MEDGQTGPPRIKGVIHEYATSRRADLHDRLMDNARAPATLDRGAPTCLKTPDYPAANAVTLRGVGGDHPANSGRQGSWRRAARRCWLLPVFSVAHSTPHLHWSAEGLQHGRNHPSPDAGLGIGIGGGADQAWSSRLRSVQCSRHLLRRVARPETVQALARLTYGIAARRGLSGLPTMFQ